MSGVLGGSTLLLFSFIHICFAPWFPHSSGWHNLWVGGCVPERPSGRPAHSTPRTSLDTTNLGAVLNLPVPSILLAGLRIPVCFNRQPFLPLRRDVRGV